MITYVRKPVSEISATLDEMDATTRGIGVSEFILWMLENDYTIHDSSGKNQRMDKTREKFDNR